MRTGIENEEKSTELARSTAQWVFSADLLAYLLTYASKQASHEASFLSSKQVVEVLACLLVGLVG